MWIPRIPLFFKTAVLILILTGWPISVAQAGLGFGAGAWGWGNGNWSPAFWVNFWPSSSYRAPPTSTDRPRPQDPQQPGVLEGTVNIQSACPTQQTCPPPVDTPQDFWVTATPYGSNQWLSTRPDAQGNYRFSLPSGGYNVQLQPVLERQKINQAPRSVIVQPGQSMRVDIQLQPTTP